MHLPQGFTEKIVRVFGDKGRVWLEQFPQILARCQDRWRLTNVRPVGGLSYNFICFAESPEYGAVALKIGVPNPDLLTERKALSLYAGRGICACYDADEELGALLLERIVPGADLRSVGNSEERFRIAAGLFTALPVALAGDHGFPSYADWISRAFTRARAENRVGPELLALVDVAERFFQEIDTPDRPHLLLHGDLHHMNILQDQQGGWKAIDPKGVIGVPCMGAARFMQNEFRMGAPADRFDRLDQMAAICAEHLGEPKQLLAKCAFVEHVLATCWSAEENADPESLGTAVAECTALLGSLSETHLARVRRLCAAFPETEERLSHGEPTFFSRKKVYAMFANNHHQDGRIAVWLPAPPGMQGMLVEGSPQKYFKPPYVGGRGWIGVQLENVSDDELEWHLLEAWRLVAPKRLQNPR